MPRPMRGANEKSKDFVGSMKTLFKNLKPWKYFILIAIILGFTSAVLSVVAPNKLSDLTDEITTVIKPNTSVLEDISTNLTNSLSGDNLTKKSQEIMLSSSISQEDIMAYQNFLEKMKNMSSNDTNSVLKEMVSLPDSILHILITDMNIEGTPISSDDLISFLKLVSNVNTSEVTDASLSIMDNLPSSIYSLVEGKMNKDNIKSIVTILIVLYVLSAIFGYVESYLMTGVSNEFAKNLRSRISKKINKLPLKYFDSHELGDILSRVTNDVDTIAQNLNNSLATLISALTLFIGSIIMMFVTNGLMALTAILSSIIGFAFMIFILTKSQKYFSQRQKELGNLNGYVEETYSGQNIIKTYNAKEEVISEFNDLNEKLRISNKRSQFLSGLMQPMMSFIGNFSYVAVCVVGTLLVMNNQISFGVIVAFMIYVRLFTNPLSEIAQATTSMQSTAAASERVFEFLNVQEMSNESDKVTKLDIEKVKGNIEFKHVKFGYDSDKLIIKDFSFSAKPGEKIAIVGPTGAGKTTLVNLLMKFYEINDGNIYIDGVNTKDLMRENIHDLFIMVLQDTWLFNGSIRDNIRFNKENVSDAEIWEACKVVGIDHFIRTLPGDLDNVLGENEEVSQGQKQLLTIARGMIKNAPFLILDEATSNVDTRTEELVQKAMDKLTEGRTSFIIAHRLSTIKNADHILVMNEGNIIEQGNHEELMKKNGFYAELYNSQFTK